MIQFNRPVPEASRAAVERALSVTTSQPVTGSWAWLTDAYGGSRVHWRPKDYWPVGTTVKMVARLYGVDMGNGAFGRADLSTDFTIGRSQIVKADARSHRIQVVRDGQVVMDLPASYGADSDPRRITRSGTHIVMAKAPSVLMSNPDFGYTNVKMNWAVRISNNGEFIHANPASNWAQGKSNVTHGCINLSTGQREELLRHRRLRRSGRDHRHLGAALRVRRRRLRLGHPVGPVDEDVRPALGTGAWRGTSRPIPSSRHSSSGCAASSATRSSRWRPSTSTEPTFDRITAPLKEQVKEQGLWAAHLPPELGGGGFGQVKLGLMHEILGRCRFAPGVFGNKAPDSGNAELLAIGGSAEQKERWMHPLLRGRAAQLRSR